MNILGFSITRRSAPAEQPVSQLSPDALAWLAGHDTGPRSTPLTNAYQQVVWVYRAINALAEQVANIPFLFSAGERGRENLITSGPLIDFYNRPHPQLNRFQYWDLRVLWLMLRGESFRIPIYDDPPEPPNTQSVPRNAPHATRNTQYVTPPKRTTSPSTPIDQLKLLKELAAAMSSNPPPPRRRLRQVLFLDPVHFQHIIQDGRLAGWQYTNRDPKAPFNSYTFLPEEVWYERLPNPFDPWRGLAPLWVAELAAKTDFAAAAFMRGLLENNADLGLIVRTAEPLEETQRQQILAELRNRRRGAGTANNPLLLWNSAEVIQPSLSSADLQFLENRKFSRAEICAAFGVPEEIVTTTDHSKYDVMQGARLNFIENRVAPFCARLEAEENNTSIPAIMGHTGLAASKPTAEMGWFDLESLPIMQAARRSRLVAAKTGFDMGIPFNELNRVLDLGFKPQPWGDTGFLPAKYRPVNQAAAPATSSVRHHLCNLKSAI